MICVDDIIIENNYFTQLLENLRKISFFLLNFDFTSVQIELVGRIFVFSMDSPNKVFV